MLISCVARRTFLLLLIGAAFSHGAHGEDWPGWRGPRGDGISGESAVPTKWDGVSGENIAWKYKLPGSGHSSPIVWQDRVFLVACDEQQQQRLLVCIDRRSGQELWKKPVLAAPLERKHDLNSYASGTPATDGERVYVTFLSPDFGSNTDRTPGDMMVAAYDFDGRQLWQARPGRFASIHGFCSSPVLFENLVLLNGDHDGDAYLVALDRETGEVVWKVDRPHKTRSYVTPIVRHMAGRWQMILSGNMTVASYDPRTGVQHWVYEGPTEQFVASVVEDGERIFVTAGFPDRHVLALRPTGDGVIDESFVEWRTTKNCSYVPSPVVVGQYLIVAADNGVVSCYRAASGERLWVERLGRQYSSSLVATGPLAYLTDEDGVTKIIRPGEQLEVLAENKLGEPVYASPAISQGQLFLRGTEHLFCIGAGR